MAITTTQSPQLISPVYSPMNIVNSSDISTLTGYRYKYDIKTIEGTIATKRVFPFPNNLGRIDVSPILHNFTQSTFDPFITGITSTTNSIIKYSVDISSTGSTSSETLIDNGVKYCFNGASEEFDFTDYMMDDQVGDFLTHSPLTISVYLKDYYTLSFLNGQFSGTTYRSYVNYLYIKVVNTGGTITYRLDNDKYDYVPDTGLTNVDDMYRNAGVGPVNLNNTTGLAVVGGGSVVQPIITDKTLYYEVYMVGYGGLETIVSLVYRFNVNHDTRRFGHHQIAFLNRLGNFSYFTFVGKMIKTTKRDYDTFLKNKYYMNGNNQWVSDSTRREETSYTSNSYNLYTFNSNYIDNYTYNFMEELFTSTEVYYLSELNGVIPITIIDTDWNNLTKENDKALNFTLKCKSANKNNLNI